MLSRLQTATTEDVVSLIVKNLQMGNDDEVVVEHVQLTFKDEFTLKMVEIPIRQMSRCTHPEPLDYNTYMHHVRDPPPVILVGESLFV